MSSTVRASKRVLLPATLALALVTMLVLRTSSAAFTATTEEPGNAFETGAIALTDDGQVSAMFDVTGMLPGDTETRCVNVTYTGDVAPADLAAVKVFAGGAQVDTDGLAAELDLQIREGSGAAVSPSCAGFVAASTSYATAAFSTFLAATTYAAGWGTWTPSGSPETRSYEIAVTLPADAPDTTQGDTLSDVEFVWELRTN